MEADIKYNYFIRDLRGGEKCSVLSIEQISPSLSNEKTSSTPCIQTYDCGFRRDGTHGDYSMWNGSIFIDIDSKKFNKEFKFEIFKKSLINCLEIYYPQNYHWNQTSSSGNSLHIGLYFNCERNETNFKKCCQLGKNIILDCGKRCGEQFYEILNYPSVVDDCTSHIGQPFYISAYPITISSYLDLLTGECNLDDIELIENEFTEQEVSFISNAKYKLKKNLDELPDYEYKSCRYPLCWIIFKYFNFDYDKCKEVWSKILPLILLHRTDYKEEELWSQFNRDYKMSKGKEYAFKSSLLEWCKNNLGFKYTIKRKFEPHDIDLYKADIEYDLDENEYLNSIDIKFCDGFNHIFAGCGVGKTRFGIEQGKTKKVCFISPMTSINKNSFGKVSEKWIIIDSNYKDEAIHICGSVEDALRSKWSICTTWESFALYEMYKYDFDMFIVDESHTMYMYDYRVKSIQKLKQALNNTNSKVVFMSGTPSFEIHEFDCYKIKINKKITHVPCDIVFYNEQYKGYIYDDIKEWVNAELDNLAVIFYDKTNYKTEEEFKYYGLDIDIFNKNYRDNTNWILENENVKNQITAFSVYGQAGINIFIDTTKKIRMYILNNNALSIIQYANRIRNKEVIDKVVIPFKIDRIDNRITPVDEKANFEEAYNKVSMINETIKTNNKDVFKLLSNKQLINLRFGLPTDVLGVVDDNVVLMENIYETWNIITHICSYESQIQLIYNHLKSNQFDLNYIYLDNDKKQPNRTRMRSTQFAGQMIRFDFDKMVKLTKDESKIYLDMDKSFEKIATGDTKEVIERILNHFWNETRNLDDVKNNWSDLINGIVREKGTIKKIDLSRFDDFLHIRKHFHEYVDNAFLIGLMNPELDAKRATAMYVRYIWSDKIDWKIATDEVYENMRNLKNIVSEYHEYFLGKKNDANKLNIENDDKTQMIYTYVCGKHSGKRSNGVVVNGVRYESMKDAAEKLGKSLSWVKKYKES